MIQDDMTHGFRKWHAQITTRVQKHMPAGVSKEYQTHYFHLSVFVRTCIPKRAL